MIFVKLKLKNFYTRDQPDRNKYQLRLIFQIFIQQIEAPEDFISAVIKMWRETDETIADGDLDLVLQHPIIESTDVLIHYKSNIAGAFLRLGGADYFQSALLKLFENRIAQGVWSKNSSSFCYLKNSSFSMRMNL